MEHLKLSNQICFPLYATSRMVTKAYQPFLKELGITYPQYLVLLVLWEQDGQTVNSISQTLFLETNTITPLLKRMEKAGILTRSRSKKDERVVVVSLTEKGIEMKNQADQIPFKLIDALKDDPDVKENLFHLHSVLDQMLNSAKS